MSLSTKSRDDITSLRECQKLVEKCGVHAVRLIELQKMKQCCNSMSGTCTDVENVSCEAERIPHESDVSCDMDIAFDTDMETSETDPLHPLSAQDTQNSFKLPPLIPDKRLLWEGIPRMFMQILGYTRNTNEPICERCKNFYLQQSHVGTRTDHTNFQNMAERL